MNALRRVWAALISPSLAKTLAAKELENARRSYLENKTHQEFYASQVTFELGRITRLEKYLEEPIKAE